MSSFDCNVLCSDIVLNIISTNYFIFILWLKKCEKYPKEAKMFEILLK